MSFEARVSSEKQLVRLLQIGIVLEEVVEARASKHYQLLTIDEAFEPAPKIQTLLTEANEESAEHRERLECLLDQLDAETVPFAQVQRLVEHRYRQVNPDDFDDVLYDQLHGEESAYKFYDDLITAIENSETVFSHDRDSIKSVLSEIREEEAEGVKEVTALLSEETSHTSVAGIQGDNPLSSRSNAGSEATE